LGFFAVKLIPTPLGSVLREGFLIVGWVANWRPLEIFLYDWRPMRRQLGILTSLGGMRIEFPAQASQAQS
jgi:hypothetical protein